MGEKMSTDFSQLRRLFLPSANLFENPIYVSNGPKVSQGAITTFLTEGFAILKIFKKVDHLEAESLVV